MTGESQRCVRGAFGVKPVRVMAAATAMEQKVRTLRGCALAFDPRCGMVALTAACSVSDRKVSLADAGGSGDGRDGGGSGDGGPRGGGDSGSSSTAGSGGAGGSNGSSGSSGSDGTCEPARFDESRFDQACFQ